MIRRMKTIKTAMPHPFPLKPLNPMFERREIKKKKECESTKK